MTNFLEYLWWKLFPLKSDIRIAFEKYQKGMLETRDMLLSHSCQAYDPSEDPEKILKGEVESYFD